MIDGESAGRADFTAGLMLLILCHPAADCRDQPGGALQVARWTKPNTG
jgi:hypothetical protein